MNQMKEQRNFDASKKDSIDQCCNKPTHDKETGQQRKGLYRNIPRKIGVKGKPHAVQVESEDYRVGYNIIDAVLEEYVCRIKTILGLSEPTKRYATSLDEGRKLIKEQDRNMQRKPDVLQE